MRGEWSRDGDRGLDCGHKDEENYIIIEPMRHLGLT